MKALVNNSLLGNKEVFVIEFFWDDGPGIYLKDSYLGYTLVFSSDRKLNSIVCSEQNFFILTRDPAASFLKKYESLDEKIDIIEKNMEELKRLAVIQELMI